MARELSQEAVLDFLWGAGGRAPNTALLRHFQRFLRDPALTEQQRRERREYFKSLVNSLATVHPAAAPGASKDVVLRRRYRDLLDEELPPPEEKQEKQEEEKEPPPRRDPGRRRGPPGEAAAKERPGGGQPPGAAVAGGCAARGRGGPCCECRRARRAAAAAPPVLSRTELPLPRSPPPPRAESPPSRSLPLLSAPGVLPLSRSLQALPASPSPSPPLLSGPAVLPSTRLPPSQSRSLQQLPTGPSPSLPRGSRVLTPNGPNPCQALLLHSYQTLPLPSGPGVLPPTRPPPAQSPPHSPTQPPPARPPPAQSLLPAQGPAPLRAPERSPPAPLPVFRSIRCQLALLEVQGIPPSLPEDCGRQPRTMPSKSSTRNVPSRGLSVPLGQREHAWLVAVSAGCWARVRGLFLEEPELALQRDFMSGFTVLHWLAKHGDGPGLQELAAAARQAGLALDVDARSGCGYTPLHLAAIHGHQLVIKVLVLQLGCQVQVRDSSGRRPWEYLGSSTSGEIWQLLGAPRGTIMFPTQPLARSVSSVSKVSLSAGRAALPACLRPQHGRGAASHLPGSESD
ncbi:ankyrin repeat domain-containing protein SOWAHB [Gavia stellata]|uniref:ankyrin repeat domain-containing protein SOWAHB n=1 Tax=Gavia stellata TaxID=37040 RepID=UPI0028A28480|nr:ankyrin repeat domain-containing protein SOWAHB [Gavia stellata]